MDEAYLIWMVFASLVVVGVSTLIQVRRIGPIGGGAVLPMFTAAFSIPFCIAAVAEGGPGTLAALVLISAVTQLAISRWLFILRRVVTPIVGGTVMMILSITLASVVFDLLDLGPVVNALMKSGITTGGFGAIAMILYLELTNPRRMRFESKLDIEVLPELNEFMARFAERRGWDEAMKNRLSAVGEETLLTLAPLDLTGDGEAQEEKKLVVVASSSEGEVAELEFIGGGDDETNIEDRVRQLQQHDTDDVVENELSLQLLRAYASSVRHQQFHDADIITVRVEPPGA